MGLIQNLFGGPTPPLKPSGPAPFAQPPERDRQALFWWLKRNTSYTAIEHNAALWSVFVAEWERWLRSQDAPYEHLIETLKYALDTQMFYERGLKRLKQGDHSVFNRTSSEGWLGKVNTGLINRRMEWDGRCELIAEQDGVPLSMLLAYYKAHDAAMAVGHRAGYEGLDFHDIEPGFPVHATAVMSARSLLNALPFTAAIPEPRWDVYFNPGGCAPKDGIYEQVDAAGYLVGNMQYFIKGQSSEAEDGLVFGPNQWSLTNKPTSAFYWRLIWEDTRYKDGTVPQEEKLYPVPSDSVKVCESLEQGFKGTTIHLRCEAGQPCSHEGMWTTPAASGSRHFKQGEIMPDVESGYGLTIWYCERQQ